MIAIWLTALTWAMLQHEVRNQNSVDELGGMMLVSQQTRLISYPGQGYSQAVPAWKGGGGGKPSLSKQLAKCCNWTSSKRITSHPSPTSL